jgi:hypothetical protein
LAEIPLSLNQHRELKLSTPEIKARHELIYIELEVLPCFTWWQRTELLLYSHERPRSPLSFPTLVHPMFSPAAPVRVGQDLVFKQFHADGRRRLAVLSIDNILRGKTGVGVLTRVSSRAPRVGSIWGVSFLIGTDVGVVFVRRWVCRGGRQGVISVRRRPIGVFLFN